jgi:hypothetical protein
MSKHYRWERPPIWPVAIVMLAGIEVGIVFAIGAALVGTHCVDEHSLGSVFSRAEAALGLAPAVRGPRDRRKKSGAQASVQRRPFFLSGLGRIAGPVRDSGPGAPDRPTIPRATGDCCCCCDKDMLLLM